MHIRNARSLARIPVAMGLAARLAAEHARRNGVELRGLLDSAGLTVQELEDAGTRLPVAHQIRFLDLVARALDDELLGFHLALEYDLRRGGLFYYVLASSDTLLDVLERGARFTAMVNEGFIQECVTGRNFGLALSYTGVERQEDRHQIEFWLATLLRLCRRLTGKHLTPVRVRLSHDRPAVDRSFEQFIGCRAEYRAPRDEILFAREDAALSTVHADPFLSKLLLDVCERQMARHRKSNTTFVARVEKAIAPLLPHGRVAASSIAAQFGMSGRTFARRLAQERVSYSQLLDRLRLTLARRYLATDGLTISRVAWLLGYKEVSAFSHAYRRWTGKSPSETVRQARRDNRA